MDIQGQMAPAQRAAPWPHLAFAISFNLNLKPAILSLVSSTLLLLAVPSVLRSNANKPDVVAIESILGMKSILCALLVALDLECLMMWAEISTHLWDSTIIATFVSSIACVCLTFLVVAKHTTTVKSSATIAIWLLFSIGCDLARLNWYFRDAKLVHVALATLCLTICKCGLLLLEELPKRPIVRDKTQRERLTIQQTRGFWTRTIVNCYFEINMGFRVRETADVVDEYDEELTSKHLLKRFKIHWIDTDKTSHHCLRDALYRTHKDTILEALFAQLCVCVFRTSQVPFLWYLLAYKEQPGLLWTYKGKFILLAVLICAGITISRASHLRLRRQLQSKIRSTILAQVYNKILTSPSPRVFPDALQSFINTTVDEFVQDIATIYDGSAGIIDASIGVYLFYASLGWTAVFALTPAIASYLLGWYISKYYAATLAEYKSSIAIRAERTSIMFSQIKAIKMAGLERVVFQTICVLQEKCITLFECFREWGICIVMLDIIFAMLPGPMIITGTLLWNAAKPTLLPRDAFAVLTNIALLYAPFCNALIALRDYPTNMLRLQRMQEFLLNDDSVALATIKLESSVDSPLQRDPENQIAPEQAHVQQEQQPAQAEQHSASLTASPQGDLSESARASDVVVDFQQASIVARGTSTTVLQDVNVSIKRGELVMVVGPTGSGKSMLLKAIVGDATVTKGPFFKEPGKVAYCDQNPWLYHASVLENVVGKSHFDIHWYKTVLECCLLVDDLKQHIRSDKSVVGSNSSGLSSGQAHRVALARALYLRAPTLVLDDIFAALDRRTANQIFANLFGTNGLLRRMQTTVIMATRPSHVLQTASRVVFIDTHSRVSTRQDYHSTAFREQLRTIGIDTNADSDLFNVESTSTKQPPVTSRSILVPKKKIGTLQSFCMFVQIFSFSAILKLLVCVFISSACEGFAAGYVRIWLELDPTNTRYLYGLIGLVVCNLLSSNIGVRHWCVGIDATAARIMHGNFLDAILGSKIYFLAAIDQNIIVSKFNDAMQLFCGGLSRHVIIILSHGGISLTGVLVVAAASVYSAPLAGILCFSVCIGWYCFSQVSTRLDKVKSESESRLVEHFVETAAGQRHIQNLGWKQRAVTEGQTLLDAYQKPLHAQLAINDWLIVFTEINSSFCVLTLVLIAIFTEASVTGVGSALAVAAGWNYYFARPIKAFEDARRSSEELARLYEFFNAIPSEYRLPRNSPSISPVWPQRGRIMMNQVTAKYSTNGKRVLKGVSFAIAPGHKVGIVGKTGSGKSSILMALLNFLDYEGTIKIDGIDIRKVSIERLRASITTISHEQIQLDGSVRHNLYPWPTKTPINDDTLSDVLTQLGLWYIVKKRGGLDKAVSEIGLSFGQQQLLSIGRGMIHKLENNTKIVIMDESTSSLDLGTEKMVQRAMGRIFRNCTILVVAHRKEILEDADTILHISDGDMFARTYPKAERAAAAKAKAKAEKETKLKQERDNVENAVEVEGGREFDGDDELDEDDDEADQDSNGEEAKEDRQDTSATLHPTETGEEDVWVGVETGSVPPVAAGLQQIVAEMENTRPSTYEGSSEEKIDGVIEYFKDRRPRHEEQAVSSRMKAKEDSNHTV